MTTAVSTDVIELYHFHACPYCEKARKTFRALGLDYESHLVDPDDRSEVVEVSGQEKVPVIIDGKTIVNDSTDIFEYMDSSYGDGVQLMPGRDQDRGLAQILDRYADSTWGPLYYRALKEIDDEGQALDESGREALQHNIDTEAGILNAMLSGRSYLVGATLSMADLSVSAFLNRITEMTDFQIRQRYEHLWEWYERVESHLDTE